MLVRVNVRLLARQLRYAQLKRARAKRKLRPMSPRRAGIVQGSFNTMLSAGLHAQLDQRASIQQNMLGAVFSGGLAAFQNVALQQQAQQLRKELIAAQRQQQLLTEFERRNLTLESRKPDNS